MKKAIFLGMLSLLSWYGCKEEGRIDIINEDAPAPLPLTEVTVTPRHGGAVLRYQIPKDENLLCVKAVYEINPGQFNETKASIYLDSLVLKGFGSANTTPVKVYTVGRNGKLRLPRHSMLPGRQHIQVHRRKHNGRIPAGIRHVGADNGDTGGRKLRHGKRRHVYRRGRIRRVWRRTLARRKINAD